MIPELSSVAVVVPTLDEERTISSCLRRLRMTPGVSVVVSDGGSTDGTLRVAAGERPDAIIVTGPPGRGGQLRRGCAAVVADAFIFVHAEASVARATPKVL
jgi:glycosyltransferase involved in cell wall biosynthesis